MIQKIRKLKDDGELPLILRGKAFGLREIRIILSCVKKYYENGRTRISEEICKELDWRQPNGWLKDRACRDVLLRMEKMGLIHLPPRLTKRKSKGSNSASKRNYLDGYDLETPINTFPGSITLEFAKGDLSELVWNQLVDKFHYLGHSVIVGRCIKYLVKSQERLLGAICFSSPSWQMESRDAILESLGLDPEKYHDLVITNSRFLVLPHVRVDHLASKILSIATKQVVPDWIDYYSIQPEVAETFVQPSLFDGTCYKAANWIEIGFTKGYAKRGASHRNSQEPKQIYLYGLSRATRYKLSGIADQLLEES